MSKGRDHGHGPDEKPVGTFMTTREEPGIADAQGKLEACDTDLIERSPCKVDLVERGKQKCGSCNGATNVIPSSTWPDPSSDANLTANRDRTSFLRAWGTVSAAKFYRPRSLKIGKDLRVMASEA